MRDRWFRNVQRIPVCGLVRKRDAVQSKVLYEKLGATDALEKIPVIVDRGRGRHKRKRGYKQLGKSWDLRLFNSGGHSCKPN